MNFALMSKEERQDHARRAAGSIFKTSEKRAIRFNPEPNWKETEVAFRSHPPRIICVALQPTAIELRLKGTRQVLTLPIVLAYQIAADRAGQAMIERRRHRRKRGVL